MVRALTSSQFSSFALLKEAEEHKMQHQLLPVSNKILCMSEREGGLLSTKHENLTIEKMKT
jgi:hypothetical protein